MTISELSADSLEELHIAAKQQVCINDFIYL